MRTLLAAICCGCLALAGSLVRADSLWLADDEGVSQVISNRSTHVVSIPDIRHLAATYDGGAWAMSSQRLIRISRDGNVRADVDLTGSGYGQGVSLAVDPYDDSIWIGTDARLLLHFLDDGSLAHGTSLPAVANAMVVALDQTPWLIANGQLAHYSPDGQPLAFVSVPGATDVVASGFAVDSLREQVWIAGSHAWWRVQPKRGTPGSEAMTGRNATRAMALDARSGDLWAVADQALIAVDHDGATRLEIDVSALVQDDAVVLHYDDERESILLQTRRRFARISRDGWILEDSAIPPGWFVATPPPFRLDPTFALIRPPPGASTSDPFPVLTLRVGTTCNGRPCDLPAGYAEYVRVGAEMNGAPMTDPVIDPATGRVLVVPRLPMRPGVNRLTAQATDRFGHRADVTAALRVLDDEPTANAQPAGEQAAAAKDAENLIPKAPNKAPIVALTSPAGGTTYSAGASVTITASASDPDGSIAKVEFYRGGSTLIGTATSEPYRFVWQNVAAGNYTLTAKAYDQKNRTATSAAVTLAVTNNQLPVVALTAPVQGAFYAAGESIQLAATASDPDGTVTNVEFLDGSSSIGSASSAPFAVTWTGAPPGLASIVARATDDQGGASNSAPIDIVVGQPPIVVVKNPLACSSVDGPLDLILAADAISATGAIARVEFFDGETLVGTSHGTPWQVTLAGASTGDHLITARAIDDRGLATMSRPSLVTVRTANQPPSVSLTAPSEGARFALGTTVNLSAIASDADGTVAAVDFRIGGPGGTLIGHATSAPYAVTWTNMGAGSYALVAVATDDRSATTASAPVHVTIDANILPSVALTTPAASTSYAAPANIALGANAGDSDGSIAKVEFFAGSTLIGSSVDAPYAATWNNVAAGTYALTARATDNLGGVAVSPPVAITVTVTNNALPSVTLTAPAAGGQYFAPATISLNANAADTDGTIAKVEFYANGVLIGSSVATPYAMTWDNVAGASYSITVVATDNQGAATTSTSTTIVVNASATVEPSPDLDGSTVDDDTIVVSGVVNAPANSGVLVNGMIAQIDPSGRFYANGVPLMPGTNSLTIKLVSQDGQVTTQTVSVSSSGPAPFGVVATPTDGIAPLAVTFQIGNRANLAFERLEFDFDGNGTTDHTALAVQFAEGTLALTATYPAGTFASRMTAYDSDNLVLQSSTRIITARTFAQQDDLLRGVYDGMLDRLRAGKVTAALNAITGDMQDKYNAVFTALGTNLPAAIESLGSLQPNWYGSDHSEYYVVRDTPDGQQAFLIDFIRGQDGVWRIHGM